MTLKKIIVVFAVIITICLTGCSGNPTPNTTLAQSHNESDNGIDEATDSSDNTIKVEAVNDLNLSISIENNVASDIFVIRNDGAVYRYAEWTNVTPTQLQYNPLDAPIPIGIDNVRSFHLLGGFMFFIKSDNALWAFHWAHGLDSPDSNTINTDHLSEQAYKIMNNVANVYSGNGVHPIHVITNDKKLWRLEYELTDRNRVIAGFHPPKLIMEDVVDFGIIDFGLDDDRVNYALRSDGSLLAWDIVWEVHHMDRRPHENAAAVATDVIGGGSYYYAIKTDNALWDVHLNLKIADDVSDFWISSASIHYRSEQDTIYILKNDATLWKKSGYELSLIAENVLTSTGATLPNYGQSFIKSDGSWWEWDKDNPSPTMRQENVVHYFSQMGMGGYFIKADGILYGGTPDNIILLIDNVKLPREISPSVSLSSANQGVQQNSSGQDENHIALLAKIPYYGDRSKSQLSAEQAKAYADAISAAEHSKYGKNYDALIPALLDVSNDGVPLLLLLMGKSDAVYSNGSTITGWGSTEPWSEMDFSIFGHKNGKTEAITGYSSLGITSVDGENLLRVCNSGELSETGALYRVSSGELELVLEYSHELEYRVGDFFQINGEDVSAPEFEAAVGFINDELIFGHNISYIREPLSRLLTDTFTRDQASEIFKSYAAVTLSNPS